MSTVHVHCTHTHSATLQHCTCTHSPCRGNDTWNLINGDRVAASYRYEHLRISFVWRSRCFTSDEERDKFLASQGEADPSNLTVDQVLDILVADLRKR